MARRTPYVNFHDLNLDWIIKRIKNVYNDENPPPYPVKTVNGQTGNVHLTGDDIPVSPNDTTPISTELAEKYTKPAGGIPASDLAPGVIPDPTSIIDDTAGYGVYNKTWSAHKLFQQEADILDLQNDKQDAPASAGSAGQVLGLNNNLVPVWITPSRGDVEDVQINGASIVNQGVANIPIVVDGVFGLSTAQETYGLIVITPGILGTSKATDLQTKQGTHNYKPIVPANEHLAVFYGLAKIAGYNLSGVTVTPGTYPENAKSAISQMLDAPETVSGTTPSITAKAGVRYICGEVSTLTIVAPASGCIDVTFQSGSTPTVLTVSSAKTGVTAIKWANGFNPTSLDADTTYEINILDGEYGVVGSWT